MVKPTETQIVELIDSFLNGNISYVVDEIAAMSPAEAAYVAAMMVWAMKTPQRQDDGEVLMRALARRIED